MLITDNNNNKFKEIVFSGKYISLLDESDKEVRVNRTSRDTYFISQLRIKLASRILFMINSRTIFRIVIIVNSKKYHIQCNKNEYYSILKKVENMGKEIDATNSNLLKKIKGLSKEVKKIKIKRYPTSNLTTDEIGIEFTGKNDEAINILYGSIPKIEQELLIFFQNNNSIIKIDNDLINSKIIVIFWQVLIPILMGSVFIIQDSSILLNVQLTLIMMIVLNVTTFILSLASILSNNIEKKKYELIFPIKSNYKKELIKTIMFMLGMVFVVDLLFLILLFYV